MLGRGGTSTQVSFFKGVRISPSCLHGRGFKKEIVFREIIHIREIKQPQPKYLRQIPPEEPIEEHTDMSSSGPAMHFLSSSDTALFLHRSSPNLSGTMRTCRLQMKWFKHIDVVRCFCGTFTMLICHGGAFTAAEDARPPGDKTTTEQQREKLWRAVTHTISNECRCWHCIAPPFVLKCCV